jgi:hypothetical protein
MQQDLPENIVVNDKQYPLSQFSDNVKKLVMIHAQWRKELADERLAMAKTEAAIRNLDLELTQVVLKELEEQTSTDDTEGPAGPAA